MKNASPFSSIEILESRIAPATFVSASMVTYIDLDGDLITVKTSAGAFDAAFTHFIFDPPNVTTAQQLQVLNLDAGFAGASISITAKPNPAGDGFVNVGAINSPVDLGNVTVRGDLGAINAGDGDPAVPALSELKVQSMGTFGNETQGGGAAALASLIDGDLGAFSAKTSVRDVDFSVAGNLGKLVLGGSLIGGDVDLAGNIFVSGDLGSVKITGGIHGGDGTSSGRIEAAGKIGSVAVGWSIHGGAGNFSGAITSDTSIGKVKVTGGIKGGGGENSGMIYSNGALGDVSLGAGLAGDTGKFSGRIASGGDMGAVKITGDVHGGTNENSGVIESDGAIKKVTITGSLIGGPATFTGAVFSAKTIGSVAITGNIEGGDSVGGTVEGTGFVRADRLPSVTVGGSVIAGKAVSGTLTASGSIFADHDIGKIVIKGDLTGSADVAASIIAMGQPGLAATATSDLAIKSITINGSVDRAIIDAGFGLNADAQIGTVTVLGDWSRSSIAAGINPVNDLFGGVDDILIADVNPLAGVLSSITAIIIKGQALGSPDGTGEFGFVAERIGALKIDQVTFALPAGPGTLAIGATGDLTMRQI